MFLLGLVTSVHCVAMCGGLVVTCAVKGTQDGPWYRRLTPHLAYQSTKILSYATVALVLGGVIGLVGRGADFGGFRAWLPVAAGTYMVLLGLGMTGRFGALKRLTPRPPKFLVGMLSRGRRKANADAASGSTTLATPIAFGAMTGLMPCAPLIAAQVAAAATGSALTAAAAMIGFGLGTAPLMLAFGFASSMISKAFQARMQIVGAIAVVIFGLIILDQGLMLVGSPVTFQSIKTAVLGAPAPPPGRYAVGADGVAEVSLAIRDTKYVPDQVVVPAGRSVRLIVDRQEDVACSDQIAVPAVHVLDDLKPNAVTEVSLPAMKPGRYTLTCGMGMMSGTIVAASGVPRAAAGSGPPVPILALVLFAGVAAAAGAWGVRTRRTGTRAG
jgi:sulfite exporter TauE/SafE